MSERLSRTPSFRAENFENYEEFERYLQDSASLRDNRWLFERSLASAAEWLTLQGTCGLCLRLAEFRALTRKGEIVPGGRVPNWREGLACDCTHALINRERALLHYVMANARAEPWMRALALGEVGSMRAMLAGMVHSLDWWPGALDVVLEHFAAPPGGYHLVVSAEQLTRKLTEPPVLAALARLLAPGGSFVFTTPFDVSPLQDRQDSSVIGWDALDRLVESGFAAARACLYWSEELGYLGPFNFILAAHKA